MVSAVLGGSRLQLLLQLEMAVTVTAVTFIGGQPTVNRQPVTVVSAIQPGGHVAPRGRVRLISTARASPGQGLTSGCPPPGLYIAIFSHFVRNSLPCPDSPIVKHPTNNEAYLFAKNS